MSRMGSREPEGKRGKRSTSGQTFETRNERLFHFRLQHVACACREVLSVTRMNNASEDGGERGREKERKALLAGSLHLGLRLTSKRRSKGARIPSASTLSPKRVLESPGERLTRRSSLTASRRRLLPLPSVPERRMEIRQSTPDAGKHETPLPWQTWSDPSSWLLLSWLRSRTKSMPTPPS